MLESSVCNDQFKDSSPEWREAQIINLKHTRKILDDWNITLLTNNQTLIPEAVQILESLNIAVRNFSDFFSEMQIPLQYTTRLTLSCMADSNTTKCLRDNVVRFPRWSSDEIFGWTVNTVKKDTAYSLEAMCGDINLIFCVKPTEAQISQKYGIHSLINGRGSYTYTFPFTYGMADSKDLSHPDDFCNEHPNLEIADGKQMSWHDLVVGESLEEENPPY